MVSKYWYGHILLNDGDRSNIKLMQNIQLHYNIYTTRCSQWCCWCKINGTEETLMVYCPLVLRIDFLNLCTVTSSVIIHSR